MIHQTQCMVALAMGLVVVCGCAKESAPTKPPTKPAANVAIGDADKPVVDAISAFSFVDRTAESGLTFEYRNGEEAGHFAILESLGGGLAAIDFDSDGREDVCIAGGGSFGPAKEILPKPTGLFRAIGDWKWLDVSAVSGIDGNRFYSHGIARSDFDNDGFADFAVTGYGGVDVYHNLGDGTFTRLNDESGLFDPSWSSSAAWADLNGDSNADLYLAHYVNWSWDNHPFCDGPKPGDREVCPPRSYTGLTDCVFFSNGDGTFRNATTEAGLTAEGKGLGVVITDLDVDGDNDVYVTNDTVPNFLYENTAGALKDVSLESGSSLSDRGVPDGSMGVDVCDFNLDGLPEVWVVNYERESSALYQNSGGMVFRHVSQRTGVTAVGGMFVGWGTNCQDFDLDGDEDMFVSNGHVIRYPTNAPLKQKPLLFENAAGRFRNAASGAGTFFETDHMGRGSIAADFDHDGDMDLAASHVNEPVMILENTTGSDSARLAVRLIGTESPREPIGAIVKLITPEKTQTRFVRSGGSYSSSSTDWLLFGDVDRANAVLEVSWPGGRTERVESLPDGSRLFVREGTSEMTAFVAPDN